MKKRVILLFVFLFAASIFPFHVHAITYDFKPLIYPSTYRSTYAYGIDGDQIVGQIGDQAGEHGFIYNINNSTMTVLDHPQASNLSLVTSFYGIDGNKIVGRYVEPYVGYHGFQYDGSNWYSHDYPGAMNTMFHDIDGSNIVGVHEKTSVEGFLYNGSTWTNIRYPSANNTYVWGISGNNIVGHYEGMAQQQSFIYDIDSNSYKNLCYPGAFATFARGIDGDNIVGYYSGGGTVHGFIYNVSTATWQSIDYPSGLGITLTWIYGIDNGNIVGDFFDGYSYRGFVATSSSTVPEPATMLLFGIGLLGVEGFRRKFQ